MTSKYLFVMLLAVMLIVPTMAASVYADTTDDEIEIGINLGQQGIKNAVTGSVAGIFLSTIVVVGKHIKNEANKHPDPKKYGLNIIVGAIVAVTIGLIPGISNTIGTEAFEGLTFGTAFALLFVVDNVVRPIYGNWAKGNDAKANSPTPP